MRRASERVVADLLAVKHRLDRGKAPRLGDPMTPDAVPPNLEPFVPDTMMAGGMLDMELQKPVPPLGEPDPLTAGVARGDDLIEGI